MICERCRAGEMVNYERTVGSGSRATIRGMRCERCGFTVLDNDDEIWSAVGL